METEAVLVKTWITRPGLGFANIRECCVSIYCAKAKRQNMGKTQNPDYKIDQLQIPLALFYSLHTFFPTVRQISRQTKINEPIQCLKPILTSAVIHVMSFHTAQL